MENKDKEKETATETKKEKEKENNKEKSNMRLFIIAAIIGIPVLVFAGVFAGVYFINTDKNSDTKDKAEHVEEEVFALDEFLLNVECSDGEQKYIRMDVSLSATDEDNALIIEENTDRIRDIIIDTVSKQDADKILSGADGTHQLKLTIRDGVNDSFEAEVVHQVYITNIVMQ